MRPVLPFLFGLPLLTGDGHWSSAAPLPEPIQELSAAVLRGKIYVAGGIDRTGRPTAATFRYDPAANRWEHIAVLPAPRHHMPLAVVGDTLYGAPREMIREKRSAGEDSQSALLARNFLHAAALAFKHPVKGASMAFETPLPVELESFLHQIRESNVP